jgi:hypothetical protein
MTEGLTSGRGSDRDQSAAVLLTRAILVDCHAGDRRDGRRRIDPAARVASLARHADFDAFARVGALARSAPRTIRMVFADPSAVIAKCCTSLRRSGFLPLRRERQRRDLVVDQVGDAQRFVQRCSLRELNVSHVLPSGVFGKLLTLKFRLSY